MIPDESGSQTEKELDVRTLDRTGELARSAAMITALSRVATRIKAAADLDNVLETLGTGLDILGITCCVLLLDPDDGAFFPRYISLEAKVIAAAEKLLRLKVSDARILSEHSIYYDDLVQNKQPLFIPDIMPAVLAGLPNVASTVVNRLLRLFRVVSQEPAIFVPLVIEDQLLGVLMLWGQDIQRSDLTASSIFAGQVAVAIKNAQLHQAQQKAHHIAEVLRTANLALTETLDLDTVLESLLDSLSLLVHYDSASVMFLEADSRVTIRAMRGYQDWTNPEQFRQITFAAEETPTLHTVLTTQKSLLIPDTRKFPGWKHRDGTEYIRNWLGVPLIAGGQIIGLYSLDKAQKAFFTAEDLYFAESLAPQAAVAIQNASLFADAQQTAQQELAERKEAKAQLLHNAFHDKLTGLPNRTLFLDHLKRSIGHAKRRGDYLFAVLFLDLDRFKVINDSLSHLAGDQLLVAIARRLESCVRPGDTVARLGGDEYAVLFDDIKHVNDVHRMVQEIQHHISRPLKLNEQEVSTTASIGIALSKREYTHAEEFLRDADIAMYRAKAQGGARHILFDTNMHTRVMLRLRLETELRRAIENKELKVHYQPVISLSSGQMTKVEALLRWPHPERGYIPPADFIPVAEETGLIVPIGEWVLYTACREVKTWHDLGYGSIQIAVNVSMRQFQQQNLPAFVEHVLRKTGLSAKALELEITESIAMISDGPGEKPLHTLNEIGVQLSIDDFGTGYSSLSRLKSLPVNTLKIDQSFIRDIGDDAEDETLITAMIAMAHALNLKVVAEGVETKEQLDFLRLHQCDLVQGYLLSHALPAKELIERLKQDCDPLRWFLEGL